MKFLYNSDILNRTLYVTGKKVFFDITMIIEEEREQFNSVIMIEILIANCPLRRGEGGGLQRKFVEFLTLNP